LPDGGDRRRAGECAWLVDELGFDAAIDYKAGDLRAELRRHTPDGVDVYFDNVGGETLDEVLLRLARGARVVICGAISQYNAQEPPRGPANYLQLLVERASMTGFLVFDYAARYPEAIAELAGGGCGPASCARARTSSGAASSGSPGCSSCCSAERTPAS